MRIKITFHMDVPTDFCVRGYGTAVSYVRMLLSHAGLHTSVWHIQYTDGPNRPPGINALGPTGRSS